MYVWVLLAIGTTMWVGIDSHNLGMRKGALKGNSLDLSTTGWVFVCLLLWIVAFPCYLVARGRYLQIRSQGILSTPTYKKPYVSVSTPYFAPQTPYTAPQTGQPTIPPPQISAGGHGQPVEESAPPSSQELLATLDEVRRTHDFPTETLDVLARAEAFLKADIQGVPEWMVRNDASGTCGQVSRRWFLTTVATHS